MKAFDLSHTIIKAVQSEKPTNIINNLVNSNPLATTQSDGAEEIIHFGCESCENFFESKFYTKTI